MYGRSTYMYGSVGVGFVGVGFVGGGLLVVVCWPVVLKHYIFKI